jgi:signal transduction histidine kinase
LNGKISFESQVGEGTTFIIEIKKWRLMELLSSSN